MPKFGGVGKMKQCCLTKQCIAPILPSTASCQVCLKKKGSRKLSQLKPDEILYECERCMEIHHLPCFHVRFVFFLVVEEKRSQTKNFLVSRMDTAICQRTKVFLVMTFLKLGSVQNV